MRGHVRGVDAFGVYTYTPNSYSMRGEGEGVKGHVRGVERSEGECEWGEE